MHRRNDVKDERYPHISSPRSKDADMRRRSMIVMVPDARQCGSEGSLCSTTTQISRLPFCSCRLSRTDKSLVRRGYTGMSKSHTVDASHLDGIDSVGSRNSHYGRTEHRDSRTGGTRAILGDMLAYCYYNAIDMEHHSKIFFDIAKCALPSPIVGFFLS